MRPILFSLAFGFFGINSAHAAGVKVISTRTEIRPVDSSCGQSESCDLLSVQFTEMKKTFEFDGEPPRLATYLTDARLMYRVTDPGRIEAYGIVQLVRGCLFISRKVGTTIVKELSIGRTHFGQVVPFQHREWQIDSDTTDPLFSSDAQFGRFGLLKWNQDPTSINLDSANWYAKSKPPHGAVFMSYMPDPGVMNPSGSAQNASLEYKTCLYKISDLPLTTTPSGAGVDVNHALWCVSWDHKYVWDYKTDRMGRPAEIDPVCDVK